jgi:PleD family two-component response regulator
MSKRILIADDEADYALLMRRHLERHDYEIVEVFRGADVFRRVAQERFDLIILDYFLPDIKGDRICSDLRSEEQNKDLPILMVTGYHNMDESMFKEYGATDVLYKPFKHEEFEAKVQRCLSASKS